MKLMVFLIIIVAVLALVVTEWQRQQRVKQAPNIPPGFQPTDEVVVDPTTRVRQRVWYNPTTGERLYVAEGEPPAHPP
ncbi:MAG: hypothetical protein IRZ10_12495 [Thermoflavifilum sp.]|nr:hypothetical protein [Thermoflavifilum sp.]MCL6515219.1 hypothetical protein [Alicyclobacillus sp.]